MNTLIGKTLGQYHILAEIGRGGMAVVYKAEQTSLDRFVALKVLFPNFTGDSTSVERLHREAQAAARLDHPNIVEIYEVGEHEGLHFIAMKYVDGESLDKILQQGALPPARALKILAQVASALDYAHRHNVVHRDIKPSNIIVSAGDRITLTDFGLAKGLGSATLTSAGALVGTPAYMSPEQARGDEIDYRSDIYSLGVIAYEMFAGRPPFIGNPLSIILAHASQTPPPMRQFRPELSPSVEAVVLKALAKEPAERYTTAGEFAAALRQALARPAASLAPDTQTTSTAIAPPAHPTTADHSRLVWGIAGAIAVVAIAVGIGAWAASGRGQPTPPPAKTPAVIAPSPTAFLPAVAPTPTYTPSAASTPTPAESPAPTLVSTAPAVDTATPPPTATWTASPAPTDTPSPLPTPTATRPARTASPAITLSLTAPTDGQAFPPDQTPVLSWSSSRPLAGEESYVVVIERIPPPPNTGIWYDYHITRDNALPAPQYLVETSADGQFVWYVQVMRGARLENGQPLGTLVGQPSTRWSFSWRRPSAGGGGTAPPRPTPTRDD
ncbi:MAG: protein kinase domain-containing protein [Anaerolineae bacterium]